MYVLPYAIVKDEFRKAIQFTQSTNLHLATLPSIYQFDICIDHCDESEPIIATFQFNKRLTGDLHSRPKDHWKPIEVTNLLFGYFQSQLSVFESLGHYHTDGHPKNLLYDKTTEPATIYLNDLGFTSGFELDNSRHDIHNHHTLHPSYIRASDQVFQLLKDVITIKSEDAEFASVSHVVLHMSALHSELVNNKVDVKSYFTMMFNKVQNLLTTTMAESEVIAFAEQGPMKFFAQYVAGKFAQLNERIKQQDDIIKQQGDLIKQQGDRIKQQNERLVALEKQIQQLLQVCGTEPKKQFISNTESNYQQQEEMVIEAV